MTFEEMRMRLVNRDAIREKQEEEERAEDLREMEEAARQRQLEKKRLQGEVQGKAALASLATAADTETERKFKAAFLKEISKVVVKVLEEYRNTETSKIKTKEDFKNLAKKVPAKNKMENFVGFNCLFELQLSHQILAGEMKHGRRVEDLKLTDRVKKKITDFVHKCMAKYDSKSLTPPQSSAR